MVIRKPTLSVAEARRLAEVRSTASQKKADEVKVEPVPPIEGGRAADIDIQPSKHMKKSGAEADKRPGPVPIPAEPKVVDRAQPVSGRKITSEKTQIYVSALFPASGVSQTFDFMCRHYPPQKALQMVLRRALQDYDAYLESGRFQGLQDSYVMDETLGPHIFVQTSRMMHKSLIAIARAHFDPLGLESTRAFGRKLATAALAAFFTHEPKRPL